MISPYSYLDFTVTYDSDEDLFSVSLQYAKDSPESKVAMTADGTKVNDLLKGLVVPKAIYTLNATAGKKPNGDVMPVAPNSQLVFYKNSVKLVSTNYGNTTVCGEGSWQYGEKDGLGFMLMGEMVDKGFFSGGLSDSNKVLTINTKGMSTIGEIIFTLDDATWETMKAALAAI